DRVSRFRLRLARASLSSSRNSNRLVTRRRFIADEFSSNRAALTGDHADHLIRVLRARVGQEFDIVTGSAVRLGCIASIEDRRVEFDLREELPDVSLL